MLTVDVQSIGKTTKYLPPKISRYDHPPTKKPKSGKAKSGLTPEEMLPAGGSDVPVDSVNIVSTPGEILPVESSNAPGHAISPSPNPTPPTETGPIRASRMRIILECRDASTVPSVLDLLTLMDQDYPTPDRNYVDTLSEFYDFGVEDVLDVFGLPCGLLASFGDLGSDRAHQLHDYV